MLILPPQPCHLRQARNLTLPLTSCSTPEGRSWTSSGLHCRAGPAGVGVGEPTLSAGKQENLPSSLIIAEKGKLGMAMQDTSPWWWGKGRAGGLTNLATTQVRARVMSWPTSICPICWNIWRDECCRSKAKGSLRHRVTTIYPRRAPGRAQHQ